MMKTKMNEKEVVKTTTLSAQVAISRVRETGLNHVQVLPDNPRVGQVEAFRGLGYGQMLSTGTFEFVRHRITRSRAHTLYRLPHSTLSKCKDRTRRFTFIVHEDDLRQDSGSFSRWLLAEALETARFVNNNLKKNRKEQW